MGEELKCCPFCGGESRTKNTHARKEDIYDQHSLGYVETIEYPLSYVYCSKCYAMTYPFETEAEAISAWNRQFHIVSVGRDC